MKDIQRGIVGGNPVPATTQQAGMENDYFKIKSYRFDLFRE